MANYYVEIEGRYTRQQIEQAINGEEAGGSEFLGSHVVTIKLRPTNLAEFQELEPPGTTPNGRVSILLQSDAAPQGKELAWNGTMIAANHIESVNIYR